MRLPLTPSTRGKNTGYKLRFSYKNSRLSLCECKSSYLFRGSTISGQYIPLNFCNIPTTQSLLTSLVRFGIEIGNNWISECFVLLLKWYDTEASVFLKIIILKKFLYLDFQILIHLLSIFCKSRHLVIKWWILFPNLRKNKISKPIPSIRIISIRTIFSPFDLIFIDISKNLILWNRKKWTKNTTWKDLHPSKSSKWWTREPTHHNGLRLICLMMSSDNTRGLMKLSYLTQYLIPCLSSARLKIAQFRYIKAQLHADKSYTMCLTPMSNELTIIITLNTYPMINIDSNIGSLYKSSMCNMEKHHRIFATRNSQQKRWLMGWNNIILTENIEKMLLQFMHIDLYSEEYLDSFLNKVCLSYHHLRQYFDFLLDIWCIHGRSSIISWSEIRVQ